MDNDELISKGEEMFDDFLRTINAEILGADLIDVGLILGDYFGTKPPFENSEKKKSEFPDAFIAQQIRKRFGETEEVVIVINRYGQRIFEHIQSFLSISFVTLSNLFFITGRGNIRPLRFTRCKAAPSKAYRHSKP